MVSKLNTVGRQVGVRSIGCAGLARLQLQGRSPYELILMGFREPSLLWFPSRSISWSGYGT